MAGSMAADPVRNRTGRALRSSQCAAGPQGRGDMCKVAFDGWAAYAAASAASVMLSAGVPLKVVSEIFGHASVAITGDVYGHVSPDVSRDALTRLSGALS